MSRTPSGLTGRSLLVLWLLLFTAPALAQPSLEIRLADPQTARLSWAAGGPAVTLQQNSSLALPAGWQPAGQTPTVANGMATVTVSVGEAPQFFRLVETAGPEALVTVAQSSPTRGERAVSVTRETIFWFSSPLAADTLIGTDRLFAEAAGRQLLARAELSTDRRKVTLFYLEPLPGGGRVQVVLDGEGIQDAQGRPVDFDGDGLPGGRAELAFDTFSTTPIPGTAVVGNVFAAESEPGDPPRNKPLQGVTVTVDGLEQSIRAVTDANGFFKLEPVPAGRFFVHIDGRTVTDVAAGVRYPDLAYYPFVGKAWDAVGGREDNLAGSRDDTATGATGVIYLPLIRPGTLQEVSLSEDTAITFPAAVIAENPALAGASLTVPANALFSDAGTRGGRVGIAPVPADRLPGPLPPWLNATGVITVQTDGPLNFDRPAPVCFPNLPDPLTGQPPAPGSRRELFSFNHDRGVWEPVGSMTVSADGRLVCSDPGVGILQPGWHVAGPGGWVVKPCDTADYVFVFLPGVGYVRVDLKPRPGDEPAAGDEPGIPEAAPGSPPTRQAELPEAGIHDLIPLDQQIVLKSPAGNHFSHLDSAPSWTLLIEHPIQPQPDDGLVCPDPVTGDSLRVLITVLGSPGEFLEGVPESGQYPLPVGGRLAFPIRYRPLFPTIPGRERDALFGVILHLTVIDRGANIRAARVLHYYRFLDAADKDPADGILDFPDVTHDGAGLSPAVNNAAQIREIDVSGLFSGLPKELGETRLVPFAADHFRADLGGVTFDPQTYGRDLRTELRVVAPGGTVLGTLELRGSGVGFGVALNRATFLSTLARMATGELGGASEGEKLLFDTTTEREDLFSFVDSLLDGAFYTAGPDGRLGTLDDGGMVFGEANALEARLGPERVVHFNFLDAQTGSSPPPTGVLARSLVPPNFDLPGFAELGRNWSRLSPPGRAYALSKLLHQQPVGPVEIYLDRFLDAALYDAVDGTGELARTLAKTILHEAGHQAGLLHTANGHALSVAGRAFVDDNADGFRDPDADNQPATPVAVVLRDLSGQEVDRILTDKEGRYELKATTPGVYQIEFDHAANEAQNWFASTSDPLRVTLLPLASVEVPDLLAYREVVVFGSVFEDLNADGILDDPEIMRPLAGITVRLFDSGGALVQTTVTDADGFWNFEPVRPGTYRAEPVLLPGIGTRTAAQTYRLGSSVGRDPGTVILFSPFETSFLLFSEATLRGRVSEDVALTGESRPEDPGLGGIEIELRTPEGGLVARAETDAEGGYLFPGVTPGGYVEVVKFPQGGFATTPRGLTIPVTLLSGGVSVVDIAGVPELLLGSEFDFGDAPDPRYPTRSTNNAAIHAINPDFVLGTRIDAEDDGQPNADATGDDLTGGDEDGIQFLTALDAGKTARVRVITSTAGDLDAFVDFNADGDWDDPGEKIFDSLGVTGGTNELEFRVSAAALPGRTTFARFRFSFLGGLGPGGFADVGEVEDYAVTLGTGSRLDFADAPAPYPSLLANDGARHLESPGFHLGAEFDNENDGQPNANALGDDMNLLGVDDEDGVGFPEKLVPGRKGKVVVNASAPGGVLDAFLDFNVDGDWDDPGERIFQAKPLNPINMLEFQIPATAKPGLRTFARFRFSTAGNLGPTGAAADGEVEDHAVILEIPGLDFADAPPPYPTTREHDGARHVLAPGILLGTLADAEVDGLPDPEALGDDRDGSADEDGVAFLGPLVRGEPTLLAVTASAVGRLDAWVDFNVDGDWDDPGERIFVSVPMLPGANFLRFISPLSARVDTPAFARFRFSTTGRLRPTGLAGDGEVEDYHVRVAAARPLAVAGNDEVLGLAPVRGLAHAEARQDIMAQGLDLLGKLKFRVTQPALEMGLGLNWSLGDAEEVAAYYHEYFHAFGFSEFPEAAEAARAAVGRMDPGYLIVRLDRTGRYSTVHDLGPLLVDGAGGARVLEPLTLFNDGGEPVTLSRVMLVEGSSPAFALSPPDTLAIPARGQQAASVTFDPATPGLHQAVLRIEHDGAGGAYELHLRGTGLSPGGDLLAELTGNLAAAPVPAGGSVLVEAVVTLRNRGARPLALRSLRILGGQDQVSVNAPPPGLNSGAAFVLEPGESLAVDIQTGLAPGHPDPVLLEVTSDDADTPVQTLELLPARPLPAEFDRGNRYVAMVTGLPNAPVLRRRMDDRGDFEFFLPPDAEFRHLEFDPVSGLVSELQLLGAPTGSRVVSAVPVFRPPLGPDTDGDGLADEVEFIIGTAVADPDSDRDGVNDGDEVRAGGDPLDGVVANLGILSAVRLGGAARDVVVEGAVGQPGTALAYVATGPAGLAIVDVTDPSRPVVVAELDLPGDSTAIAHEPRRQLAILTAGGAGVHYVDVADPARPRLLPAREPVTTANVPNRVVTQGGWAYQGRATTVAAVDPAAQTAVTSLDLGGLGHNVLDLALAPDGRVLYVLDQRGTLHSFGLAGPVLTPLDSLVVDSVGGVSGLGTAGNLLLVSRSGVFGGFFSVAAGDPSDLALLSAPDNPDFALGSADVAPDGDGFAVLVGPASLAGDRVNIMDVSDPTATAQLAASFRSPPTPASVTLAGGLAFIATGESGLVVASYRAPDFGRRPPVVTLRVPADVDADPASAGVQVVEGTLVTVEALATDDRLVGGVELLVNGRVAGTDPSAPYTMAFRVPSRAISGGAMTVQVRAVDTGGTTGISSLETWQIIPDRTPPRLVELRPVDQGAIRGDIGFTALLRVDEPLAPTVPAVPGVIRLRNAAGEFLAPESVSLDATGTQLTAVFPAPGAGGHELRVTATAVTDPEGNALGAGEIIHTLTAVLPTVVWLDPSGGTFNEAAKWSTGQVPGADDVVFVETNPTAQILTGQVTVKAIYAVGGRFIVGNAACTIGDEAVFENLELRGTLTGSGDVRLLGSGSGSGTLGPLPRPVVNHGRLEAFGLTLRQAVLRNRGILRQQAFDNGVTRVQSRLNLNGDAVVHNEADGRYEAASQGVFVTGSNNRIINEGHLVKIPEVGSSLHMTVSAPVENTGRIEVQAGTLLFTAALSSTDGEIRIEADATLRLTGNNQVHGLSGHHTLTGDGVFLVDASSTQVFVPGGSTLVAELGGALEVRAGTLLVEGGFENHGTFRHTGGTVNFTGSAANRGSWEIAGSGTLAGRLINHGLILHDGPSIRTLTLRDGTLLNESDGTYTLGRGGFSLGTGTVNLLENRGFFQKLANTGTSAVNLDSPLVNSGLLDLGSGTLATTSGYEQTGGELRLAGGQLTSSSRPVNLLGGIWTGTGTILGSVTSAARVTPGGTGQPGRLTVTGNFTQTAAGRLELELGGGGAGEFDVLAVSARATLDGTLAIGFIGGFTPLPEQEFPGLTFASRTGEFAELATPQAPPEISLRYDARAAVIIATAP